MDLLVNNRKFKNNYLVLHKQLQLKKKESLDTGRVTIPTSKHVFLVALFPALLSQRPIWRAPLAHPSSATARTLSRNYVAMVSSNTVNGMEREFRELRTVTLPRQGAGPFAPALHTS